MNQQPRGGARNGRVWLTVSALIGAAALQTAHAQSDPIVFTFATVGDSRQDGTSPDPTTLLAVDPSTGAGAPSATGGLLPQDAQFLQNSLAWNTIQSGIQAQGAQLLFFNGDMIFGYGRPTLPTAWANGQPGTWTTAQTVGPDAFFEYVQYAYWRGSVSPLFTTGTYVLPVPGNHETQCSFSAAPYSSGSPNQNCNNKSQGNKTGKTAYADNENAFRANTGDLVQDLATNLRFSNVTGGFAAQNVTGLTQATAPASSTWNGAITSNQADLTYSFDINTSAGLLHFAVINTDPAGADSTAPADWLATDFANAKARGVTHIFVFGHKPAFTYNYSAASGVTLAAAGLDANPVNATSYRNQFWQVMVRYGATYFCGHEHTPNVASYADPTNTYQGSAYQVLVGSGGSPFDDKGSVGGGNFVEPVLTNYTDRYYAWALVEVHQSGNVTLNVNGFSDSFGPVGDLTLYDQSSLQAPNAAQTSGATVAAVARSAKTVAKSTTTEARLAR
jgi:hypothetical protein